MYSHQARIVLSHTEVNSSHQCYTLHGRAHNKPTAINNLIKDVE